MIRASCGDQCYWERRINFDLKRIEEMDRALLSAEEGNPFYRPQYAFLWTERHLRIILRRYSRGDPVLELGQHFPGLLDAWELSNRLADEICRKHDLVRCRDWTFALSNLNHYN